MGSKLNLLQSAVIRNSRLCKSSDNFAHLFIFDKDRDDKGWNVSESSTLFGVSGGLYFLSSLGSSPSLARSDGFGSVDASTYTEVVIRYKYVKNRINSVATLGKLQFLTQSDGIYNDQKSLIFTVIPDGEWHTYRLNLGPVSTWIGNIVNLKIFFTTNGQPDDEVFLSSIKIQKPSFIFCTDSCYNDRSITKISEEFDAETLGSPPQNFSNSNVDANRVVSVLRDPADFNNRVLSLINSTGALIGPYSFKSTDSSIIRGFLSLRAYASSTGFIINLKKDINLDQDIVSIKLESDGRLKYRSGPSYINFEDVTPLALNSWHDILIYFNQDLLTFSVSVNGQTIGEALSYLVVGQVSGVQFKNTNLTSNQVYFDSIVLVSQESEDINCPGIGTQGQATGVPLSSSLITVVEGTNDKLIVNLNGYGDVIVKIPPRTYSLSEMRDELERSISILDVGGYPYAEVVLVDTYFIIRSGTYSFDSTVVVKKTNSSALSDLLGFTLDGAPIYSSKVGRPHSSGFTFSNTHRTKTIDLLSLKDPKLNEYSPVHTPLEYSAQIGFKGAGEIGRNNKLSGTNRTLIDFYHRASEEGPITKLFFHGILPRTTDTKLIGSLGFVSSNIFNTGFTNISDRYNISSGDILVIDEPGYGSNGTYEVQIFSDSGGLLKVLGSSPLSPASNLNFSIQSYIKIKQFRPRSDGSLHQVTEVRVGQRNPAVLSTRQADTFAVDVNWYVNRGDLIGIYNAKEIYVGNDINKNPDCLYLEIEGDVTGDISNPGLPKGQGVKGIGLYGHSGEFQTRASYDIVFDQPSILNNIIIRGKQKVEKRYYNLASAIANGFSLTANITGTHKHAVEGGSGPTTITHNNVGYNLQALTDGIQYASNGVLGQFQQNNSSAAYFYVSGDGEFAFYTFAEDGSLVENSPEFPIFSNGSGGFSGTFSYYIFDYKDDPFDFTFSWNVPKTIERFKVFFKEFRNVNQYFLQWLKNPSQTFDGDLAGYEKIGKGNTSEFTKVIVNDLVVDSNTPEKGGLYLHLLKDFNINPATGDSEGLEYFTSIFPYTVLDKYFTPVKTKALNWKMLNHDSTKISEIEVYASTNTSSNIDTVVELYVSSDGETFQRIDPEVLQDQSLNYLLGLPIKAIRMVTEPDSDLYLDSVEAFPIDSLVKYQNTENLKAIDSIDVNPIPNNLSTAENIRITNLTGKEATLEISIEVDELLKDLLVKTSLSGIDTLSSPEIGPPALSYLDSDLKLSVTENVAINSTAFGLENLSVGKRYYLGEISDSPTDYFATGPSYLKWSPTYTNFPKSNPNGLLAINGPGWGMRLVGTYGGPKATNPIAKLLALWFATGTFSASIVGEYNLINGSANEGGSRIGIQDQTGRRIFIDKKRIRYTLFGARDWAEYTVTDSLTGVLQTHRTFCATINTCGTVFGTIDDGSEYTLTVARVIDTNLDVLRFSYTDTVNGLGVSEFKGNFYLEVNLNTLVTPLVGPLKVYIENFWNDNPANSIASQIPTAAFNYIKINTFLFGGSSTLETTFNFEEGFEIIGTSGSLQVDNRSSFIGSTIKTVAIDLQERFRLETLQNWTPTSGSLWNLQNLQYSSTDTSNVDSVVWGNSDRSNTRWLLVSEEAIPEVATSGLKYLDYLRVYPDITTALQNSFPKSYWKDLGNVLADGNFSSSVSNLDYPVVALKLAYYFTLNNFKALDETNREFPVVDTYPGYKGWPNHSTYAVASNLLTTPSGILWDSFTPYTSKEKTLGDCNWLCFKSTKFEINRPRFISEVQASTVGKLSTDLGEVKDLVDFTEYAEWFEVSYSSKTNIALLKEDQVFFENQIYGAFPLFTEAAQIKGPALRLFDGLTSTTTFINSVSGSMWRVFADMSAVSGIETQVPVVGLSGSIFIPVLNTYFTKSGTLKEVIGFSFDVSEDTKVIPDSFVVESLLSGDPTLNSSWTQVMSDSGLVTLQLIDNDFNNQEYVFNNGETYNHTFSTPILTSGIRLRFTSSQTIDPNETVLGINDFRIFESGEVLNSGLVAISNDTNIKFGGRQSLKIDLLAGLNSLAQMVPAGSFSLGPDPLWSLQDYLSFHIKILGDLSQLDLANSFIRFGESDVLYYEWNLSDFQTADLSNLSKFKLKFKEATLVDKIGFNFDQDNALKLDGRLDFRVNKFTFFQIQFKPLSALVSNVSIWLDRFDVTRELFGIQDKAGNNTLYLNNSELIYFPLTGFDIRKGFFEASIIPDWNKQGVLRRTEENIFTIFSALNANNSSFSCYYTERFGLVIVAFSTKIQKRVRFYVGKLEGVERYSEFKLSVAWDSDKTSKLLESKTIKVWVNDLLVGSFEEEWEIEKTKDSYFFLGSRAYQSDVSIVEGEDFPVASYDIQIVPTTNSVTGSVKNFILAKTPKKYSYETIQFLKDKLHLSIDGITYYNGYSPVLPITIYNVPAGNHVDIWVKVFLPSNVNNLARLGYLKARWRLSQ